MLDTLWSLFAFIKFIEIVTAELIQFSKMFASLLRRRLTLSNPNLTAVRAPKKKKGAAVEAPTCKDIVNIWKERTDPLIYPSDMYPPYVMAMLKERYTPDDVML